MIESVDLPSKIALTLDSGVVRRIDALVRQAAFASRSQAVEEALREKLARLDKVRLAVELEKLDQAQEKWLAEEGIQGELGSWPDW